jgi:hypothetical protein
MAVLLALPTFGRGAPAQPGDSATVAVVINGLRINMDPNTGAILEMALPGPGAMLQSVPGRASLIDLAYPVKAFEPLRLASRYSANATITTNADSVTIHWDKLGASRTNFPVTGSVSATVHFSADSDGKSVIMTAVVENRSDNDVRQVVFPDFEGLLPFNGESGTWFRSGGLAGLPFRELARTEDGESGMYFTDAASYSVVHQSGGLANDMIIRWMDFGGLGGGMSLFPRRWGFAPPVTIRLQRSEVEAKLRLLNMTDVTIGKGGRWESGAWVLTPHRHGWAEGIAAYRDWVKQHFHRDFPAPKHVREGIGCRTVWMCQNQPNDPQDALFRFSDLPALARECAANGIDEMVLWQWNRSFVLPLPGPYPHLGTPQEMVDAIKECRKLGVNVAPFISVLQANPDTAPRYGLNVSGNNGWTYHSELLPRWNPPYATAFSCVQAGPLNKLWQADVLAGTRQLVDLGIPSLSWDQFWTTKDPEPNMISLAKAIRACARKADPESSFSGEELWNAEPDSAILDYTWDWGGYRDCQAFTSVFPAPRINCCVSSSALVVKKAFADNLYLNVLPRRAQSANGSGWISDHPELSQALKQCASLKKQFLPYFTDGNLIGDCLFKAPCPGTHTCAYVFPDKALLILINLDLNPRKFGFDVDIAPWVKSASGRYEARHYTAQGKLASIVEIASKWQGQTRTLAPEEIDVFEFAARLTSLGNHISRTQ